MNGEGEETPARPSSAKIALAPFVEAGPPVHVLDAGGITFPAR